MPFPYLGLPADKRDHTPPRRDIYGSRHFWREHRFSTHQGANRRTTEGTAGRTVLRILALYSWSVRRGGSVQSTFAHTYCLNVCLRAFEASTIDGQAVSASCNARRPGNTVGRDGTEVIS